MSQWLLDNLQMRARPVIAPLIVPGFAVPGFAVPGFAVLGFAVLGLASGCGGSSPTAPSTVTPPTGASPATTQGIVGATLTQATGMLVSAAPGGLSRVMIQACPGGGSMTMTFSVTTPTGPSGTLTTSSRIEFSDCRSQTVTINGDPYLMMTGEHVFGPVADGVSSSMTTTMRMTGGLRFDAGGTQGRAQYDCTHVMSMQIGSNGTTTLPSVTSSGTITWEQPLGTVMVRPCGP